jgi:hypothetical protein
MPVTFTRDQRKLAKEQGIPLVAIAIDGRHLKPGCPGIAFYGPSSGEQETFKNAVEAVRDNLRRVCPSHPALKLFK